MRLLFKNAQVATMATTAEYGLRDDVSVVVDGGVVADLVSESSTSFADVEVIDCEGMLLTPGLIDCHTHLVYAGDRALEFSERISGTSYEQLSSQGRGIQSTVKMTRAASSDSLYAQSVRRLELLKAEGVTSVEIKSGYGLSLDAEKKILDVIAKLSTECPVRVHKTFLGAHAVPQEYAKDSDAYVDLVCEEMMPALAARGLIDSVDAFCESVGFSVAQVGKVFDVATLLGLRVRLHAEQLGHTGGARLAARYRALSVDHIEYMRPDEAKLLAESGTTAVLLPGAFYYLQEEILPPIDALREHGVRIAVATDSNPGSSPICSLLTVMNMACILFGLSPEEALAGVTRNAAHALGEGDRVGTIEPGKLADLVLWDVNHPSELCYRIGENRCRRVWVGGQERP